MALEASPAATDQQLLREALDVLRDSSREIVLLVIASLRSRPSAGAELDDAFGHEPPPEAFQEALAWNLSVATERRRALIAASLTRRDVARRLAVSPQAVSDMLERGALIGLKEGREWRIPAWQLDDESPTGVVPGLQRIASRFPGSVVALSLWVAREHPDLDGLTPREALRRGDVEDVLRLVATI